MNSFTVFAGTFGLTSMTFGTRMKPATGVMSRMKSNGRFLETGVDGIGGVNEKDRVTVRQCMRGDLGCEVIAGARFVLDGKLLVQVLGEILSDQARADVG